MAANEWSHDASIARLTTVAEEYNFFQAARLLDIVALGIFSQVACSFAYATLRPIFVFFSV